MELRQIRSFLSLAKNLSFSRTAQVVHLSQPALSLQIQALKKEMGVTLFERSSRKTALTPAGIAFQREAAGGLLHLEQAMQSARRAQEGKQGVVRIGFVSTAGTHMALLVRGLHGTGASNALLITVVKPSSVPMNTSLSGGD